MRWALTVSSYEYTLVFRSTTQHGNADAMSRLPLPESPREIPDPAEWVLLIEGLKDSPISSAQIRTWTRRDSLLSQVLRCVQQGWPTVVTEELKPYWNRRLELSVYDAWMSPVGVQSGCLPSWSKPGTSWVTWWSSWMFEDEVSR